MTMRARRHILGTGHFREGWPVLLLLCAVLLPTICVLWLISRSLHSERLLVRQKLVEAYDTQLTLTRERLESEWAAKAAALDAAGPTAVAFERITSGGLADGVVILDTAGSPVYPSPVRVPAVDPEALPIGWRQAQRLETSDPTAAALAYHRLAESAASPALVARAVQAEARCLVQSGQPRSAANLVMERFARSEVLLHATDPQGRFIAGDVLLMAVQLCRPPDNCRMAANRLRNLLLDYTNPAMPSSQRLFLMKEMRGLALPSTLTDFPTLPAEEMTARLLEAEPRPRVPAGLSASALPDMWEYGSNTGRVVALFSTQRVLADMREFLKRQKLSSSVRLSISPPGTLSKPPTAIPMMPIGNRLPGWQLSLTPAGNDPFAEAVNRQSALYLWIGALIISAVMVLAILAARTMRRSLRLAGIKSDLVATVSHELKTPLASMRLLIDTLLDDAVLDPGKTREYLVLVAQENARLSGLISNFLTFSRMERNKYNFEFTSVRVDDVVQAAVQGAGERFQHSGCELSVEVAPALPEIRVDQNALVIALVNLLDNAYKYTPPEKLIRLRAYADAGGVAFEVRDNGVGIAPGEQQRIFRKFYQVDQRLSRSGGGCGLGLAIVRFLVESQGGTVRVTSEQGKGSTFLVTLRAIS
jgi:signal transduction histidine kinase